MLVTPDNTISLTELRVPAAEPIPETVPAAARAESGSRSASEHQGEASGQSHLKDSAEIEQTVHRFLENIGGKNSELAISVDKETQRIIVRVLDSKTKKVIRQIPPKELLALAEDLRKTGTGIFDAMA